MAPAACGTASPRGAAQARTTSTAPAATAPACPTAAVGLEGGTLLTPPGATTGRTPLVVVVVPGGFGDPTDRLGVARAARRAGFGVLYPTSGDGGFWQLDDRQGTSDVTAVSSLLDRALATGCFDARRVAITGVSNGAGFAIRMTCERPGRFTAVVAVAAGLKALDPCPRANRARLLEIHGTADTVVPYNGAKPDRKGSVPRFAARWARRLGCPATARTTRPKPGVRRLSWCGGRVRVLRLSGTPHGWPRASVRPGVSATAELLRFLRRA